MPHHFKRYPTVITREIAADRIARFFAESGLGLDLESARNIANSDLELKDILDSVEIAAARSSIRFGGAA